MATDTLTITSPFSTARPHCGASVRQFYSMHFLGAIFPFTGGLLLYGWRAVVTALLVGGAAVCGVALWKRVGARGRQLRLSHCLWLCALLVLMLPAQLASFAPDASGEAPWAFLPAAGLLLVTMLWLLGGLGSGRVHPVLVTYLLLVTLVGPRLIPRWVLGPAHLVTGDLLHGHPGDAKTVQKEPWLRRAKIAEVDSEFAEPASETLTRYTTGQEKPPRGWLSLQGLLRDELPPLEDLIIGGHPGPIGTGSAVAVIIGGLFLLYRGLIDFRIPLVIILTEFAALLVLPIPVVIKDHPQWHWAVFREPGVGWATGITLVNYELMASPALFTAFFLATSAAIRPMTRRARLVYAGLTGLLAGVMQLYMSCSFGPYLALLVASLLTPSLDEWFRPRPLV